MSSLIFLQLIPLLGLLPFLSCFGLQLVTKFEKFVSFVDTLPEEISEVTEVSLLTCTAECAMFSACVALLYSPRVQSCKLLHQYINKNFEKNSKESEAWSYYTLPYASTCLELRARVPALSGVYRIYPWRDRQRPVHVYCDMNTDGGGWTAIQRRVYGPVRFNRTWSEYKAGFGSAETEYWLGNDLIHKLTVEIKTALYVAITLTNGTTLYERYDQFYITNDTDGYRLNLKGNATGSLGNSMTPPNRSWNLNGIKFSTADRDNDMWSGGPCGTREGGWWFNHCSLTFLNSDYWYPPWAPTVPSRSDVRETMMMIR